MTILGIIFSLFAIGIFANMVKPLPPKNRKELVAKKSFTIGVGCVFLALVFFSLGNSSGNSEDSTVTTKESASTSSTDLSSTQGEQQQSDFIPSGGIGVLKNDCFVAISQEAEDELMNYISANNQEAVMNMSLRGQIFTASKGTRITVVDRGFVTSEIEIMDKGIRGIIPSEFITK